MRRVSGLSKRHPEVRARCAPRRMRGQELWPVVLRGSLSLAPQDDGADTGAGERHPEEPRSGVSKRHPEEPRSGVSKDARHERWPVVLLAFAPASG